MIQSLKNNIKKVVFELTIIVLGVLIALASNTWYQSYQQEQQANILLSKLKHELENNLDELNESIASYEQNIKKTKLYLELAEKEESIDYEFSLIILDMEFGVWQFGQKRDELNKIPVEMLIKLSASYRQSEQAEKLTQKLLLEDLDSITERLEDNEKDSLNMLKRELLQTKMYIDVAKIQVSRSIKLISHYQKTNELLKESYITSLSTTVNQTL